MTNGDGDRNEGRGGGGIPPRVVGLAVVALLLGLFVATNFDRVEVHFLAADVQTRMAVAILVAAALGFVLGWLVERNRRR